MSCSVSADDLDLVAPVGPLVSMRNQVDVFHLLPCPTMKLRHPAGDIRTQWSSRKGCAPSGLSVAPGWAVFLCITTSPANDPIANANAAFHVALR